jgi:hypothetical protein
VESLLADAEVSSLETGVRVRKGHNFDPSVGSPSKFTRVSGPRFPRSRCGKLLDDAEVSSLETGVRVRKGHNF